MSRKKKKKNNYAKKIILTILVICLSLVMAGGLYVYNIADKIKDVDPIENVDNPEDKKEDKKDPEVVSDDRIENILLIGTDDRKDGQGERSDAIMILTIDNKNKDIRLTSIMRDSYVKIPASKGRKESWEKINHSYAYGGASLLIRTIEENFKIDLDNYVKIDFTGFKTIVEKVGGIDVKINNKEELNELNRCLLLDVYDDPGKRNLVKFRGILERANLLQTRDSGARYTIKNNPNITKREYAYIADIADFKEELGETHLDGRQTLAYSRMRHSTGGSMGRTSRQREVIDLMIDKLPDLNAIQMLSLANEATNYIKTNMSLDEIIQMANLAVSIGNFDMKQLQVPPENLTDGREYAGFHNSYVFLMDLDQITEVMHKFIFEDEEYDPSKYKDFNYRTSEYYIPPAPKKEDEEKPDGEEETDPKDEKPPVEDGEGTDNPDDGTEPNEPENGDGNTGGDTEKPDDGEVKKPEEDGNSEPSSGTDKPEDSNSDNEDKGNGESDAPVDLNPDDELVIKQPGDEEPSTPKDEPSSGDESSSEDKPTNEESNDDQGGSDDEGEDFVLD